MNAHAGNSGAYGRTPSYPFHVFVHAVVQSVHLAAPASTRFRGRSLMDAREPVPALAIRAGAHEAIHERCASAWRHIRVRVQVVRTLGERRNGED
jgi:hypothetical protein